MYREVWHEGEGERVGEKLKGMLRGGDCAGGSETSGPSRDDARLWSGRGSTTRECNICDLVREVVGCIMGVLRTEAGTYLSRPSGQHSSAHWRSLPKDP